MEPYGTEILRIGLLGLLACSSYAKSCENINCDCFSLPKDSLKAACLKQQDILLSSCELPELAYCTIHGSAAVPTAPVTRLVSVEAANDEKSENHKISTSYWSITQDVNYSSQAFADGELTNALAIVDLSKQNLNTLYSSQASVVRFWLDNDKDKKAAKAWRKYSSDTLDLAQYWQKYADTLKVHVKSKQVNQQAISRLEFALLGAVLDVTGEVYEQAGFAYGHSGKEKDAALAWKSAADTASDLISVLASESASGIDVDRFKLLAATRLNRVSYYWLQEGKEDYAQDMAEKALVYLETQASNEIVAQGD